MPHKILIADDDPAIRDALAPYLGANGLGFDVTLAENGEEALAAAITEQFDLAILDVRMPGISGAETYARLRKLNPQLEAIFFTADNDFEASRDFLRFALPKERVLAKPIDDLAQITRLIVGILGPPLR